MGDSLYVAFSGANGCKRREKGKEGEKGKDMRKRSNVGFPFSLPFSFFPSLSLFPFLHPHLFRRMSGNAVPGPPRSDGATVSPGLA
jgi:hypothetical protein